MSLLEDFQNTCVLLEKRREIDGEGGFIDEWVEGVNFSASIVYDTSIQARVAERDGVTSLYTVTVTLNTLPSLSRLKTSWKSSFVFLATVTV